MSFTRTDDSLHVDIDTWASLIGVEPTPDIVAALAGVPAADAILDTATKPRAAVQLQTATPGGVFTHEAWLGDEIVTLLIQARQGNDRAVVPMPPDQLPAALARLVGLGPRPRLDKAGLHREPHAVDDETLDAWFASDVAIRQAAYEPLGADRAWRIVATAIGSSDDAHQVAAADGLDGGLWFVDDVDDQLTAVPTSPTVAFRNLAALPSALAEVSAR